MNTRHRTYGQVHSGLSWFYGPASEFSCVDCGLPANHWCYQYSAGDSELVSESGAVYSESFDDYAPMCRSCHLSFDMKWDPRRRAAVRRNGLGAAARLKVRADTDPDWTRERALKINKTVRERCEADPEYAARYREGKRVASLQGGMMQRRMCAECGMISNATGLHKHQTTQDHTGYFDSVDDEDDGLI